MAKTSYSTAEVNEDSNLALQLFLHIYILDETSTVWHKKMAPFCVPFTLPNIYNRFLKIVLLTESAENL